MGMEFPTEEFLQILQMAKETAEIATSLTAQALLLEVKEETPIGETHELSQGWDMDGAGLDYRIYNMVEYALAVHNGSRPHLIEPKYKKALYWPGAPHPVRSVWHPGYQGYPWTINAMQSIELRLDEFVQIALQQTGAM